MLLELRQTAQIVFLFLSLSEKETKVVNIRRIGCAGGVCATSVV